MLKSINIRYFFNYITVVFMIYISGSVFFVELYYKYAVMLWILYAVLLFILVKKYRLQSFKAALPVTAGFCEFIAALFNKDFELSPYIALFLMISGIVFLSETMTLNEYETIYIWRKLKIFIK